MTHSCFSQIRTRVYRAATVVAVLSLFAATAAEAQGRRARLSEDLAKKLARGDSSTTSVIVNGSQQQAMAVAARHGLRVAKLLATGAVLEVPADRLATLAADPSLDALSTDQDVTSTMAVTNEAIAAEKANQRRQGLFSRSEQARHKRRSCTSAPKRFDIHRPCGRRSK